MTDGEFTDEQLIEVAELLQDVGHSKETIAHIMGLETYRPLDLHSERMKRGREIIELVKKLHGDGMSNPEIAAAMRISENRVRHILAPLQISDTNNIWTWDVYEGRVGPYTRKAESKSIDFVVAFVRKRAKEDGEWCIANGHVGDNNKNEPQMRKMMAWVSDPKNIAQCVTANPNETIDWICRDLANGSKWVAGSHD